MPSCKQWLICIGTHRKSVSATVRRVPDCELFTRRYYTYLGLPQPLQQHDEWQSLYHHAGWVPTPFLFFPILNIKFLSVCTICGMLQIRSHQIHL